MAKPTVFISHIHEEDNCANALENVLRKALLGALDVFNSSNRKSIAAGDPWRDRIIDTLRNSACVLVLASPNSVTSSWVNFETGGAWTCGTRVIPCCIQGMQPSSLPAPLSDLQAVSLDSSEDLRTLVTALAETAGLDSPSEFDFAEAVETIVATWQQPTDQLKNEEFETWFQKVQRRPEKYKGDTALGYFRVKHLSATDPQETRQFPGENLTPGDSVSCWIEVEGQQSKWTSHGFAGGDVADFLESVTEHTVLHGKVKCLGHVKVFETIVDLGDEERGISYPTAWLVAKAKKA